MSEEIQNTAPTTSGGEWYVLRVISGKEKKLKEYIDTEMERSGWTNIVTQVLVPTEKVYTIRKGKKVIQERNLYPGYMLVEALPNKFSGDIIQTIRSITGVINFIGDNKPEPITQAEVNRILGVMDDASDSGLAMEEPFIIGESIKVIDGPFNDFDGTIEEIDEDKKKLKVIVKIFGRKTPVELNFMQVEKQQ